MTFLFSALLGLAALLTVGLISLAQFEVRQESKVCYVCGAHLSRRQRSWWTMADRTSVNACANCTQTLEARRSHKDFAAFLKGESPRE